MKRYIKRKIQYIKCFIYGHNLQTMKHHLYLNYNLCEACSRIFKKVC